jgi:hemerythrin
LAIVWRDEMGIDGGVMDADHKCLIALANEVDAAHPALTLQRELQVIVAKLTTYARIHFEREERWQVGAAFLFASAHRKHHIEFGHELEAISGLFRDGLSLQQMLALQAHISEVLHGWIVDHIIKADGSMKPYADQIRRNAKGTAALAEAVRLSALRRESERSTAFGQLSPPKNPRNGLEH